jgi:hypothetical protein
MLTSLQSFLLGCTAILDENMTTKHPVLMRRLWWKHAEDLEWSITALVMKLVK